MNLPACAIALALLLAGAARAEDPLSLAHRESSVSLGGGFSYELLGLNLAHRREHLEGFLGLGLLSFLAPGASIGGRYYLGPDGTGFFFALNLAFHGWKGGLFDSNGSTGGLTLWATITPGYRLAWDHFFLQAAIGGGLFYTSHDWPTPPSQTKGVGLLPDAMLAAGWRF